MDLIKKPIKLLTFPFFFGFGLVLFLFTKKTNSLSYASFRYLFVLTNGKVNDIHTNLISLRSKYKYKKASGILGNLDENDITAIVESINRNGFYQFNAQLSEQELNDLRAFAVNTPSHCIDITKKGVAYLEDKINFDENNPISPRYQFDSKEVAQNDSVRKVIFDPTFRTIASNYLKCDPILDIVTMWWSVPFNNKAASQSAQMFHFDMDRFKFLKFFFYLTDVHTDNGPHCYIRNSHNSIPAAIRKDRRINDDELKSYFNDDDIMEFTGKKGTILAVDTRGLHKGKPLVKDTRLLFQIQFSNSLFGAPYELIPIENPSDMEKKELSNHRRTYQLLN